jgi:hypothetical protein
MRTAMTSTEVTTLHSPRRTRAAARAFGIAVVLAIVAIAPAAPALAAIVPHSAGLTVTAVTKAKTTITLTSISTAGAGPIVVGQPISVTGTTSKNLRGRQAILQRASGSKWVSTGYSAKVSSRSTFKISAKAQGVGRTAYRAIAASTSKLKAASSSAKRITVYRWTYLSRITAKSSYIVDNTSVEINAVTYPNSLLMTRNNTFDGRATYNLKRECVSFVAWSGVPDTESITMQAQQTLSLDGTVVSTTIVQGGTTNPISLDVTGALELGLSRDYTDTAYGSLAFGNAKILCTF